MMARLATVLTVLMTWLMVAAAAPVSAQQTPPPGKSPLGVAPPSAERGLTAGRTPAAAAQPVEPPGMLARAWGWIEAQRAHFNRMMAASVRSLRSEPFGSALLSLLTICFGYGVLHAAGPGHGKGVISAYALANEETVKRGIILSFMSALFQALSAIAIFVVLALIFGARKTEFDRVESWLETASWALVAGLGAWLLLTRIGALLGWRGVHSHAHTPHTHAGAHHHHDHHTHHGHAHAHGHAHGSHDHGHGHAHSPAETCADCGHMHMPTPDQLQGAWSWKKAMAISATVGIRPCTGALILLAFCLANGLLWAGILGTLAMSLGTAITVSVLAALAVGSRQAVQWLSGPDSTWGRHVGTAAGLLGSALIFIMGSAFFIMSLKGPGPL